MRAIDVMALGAALVLAGAASGRMQERDAVSAQGLHYRVGGTGPAVVLIHAFQGDLREWDAVAPGLAASRRVVRYDVRGHGTSKVVSPPPSTTADLASLLDELKIPRATLVGSSMGATVALDFALTHPERVERLVLVSPGPPGIPAGPMPEWMGAIASAAKAGKADDAAKLWWDSPLFQRVRTNEAVAAGARQMVLDNAAIWKLKERPQALVPPTGTRLGELPMPVLVVAGDQDELGSDKVARAIADKLRSGRLVVIPGAGHMLSLERPGELVKLIVERK